MTYKASFIDMTLQKMNCKEQFENQYYEVKAKFSELLYTVIDTPRSRNSSLRSSRSGNSNHTPRSHRSVIYIKLPSIEIPNFVFDTCSWLHYRDTFEALFVKNKPFSNVQNFQYLIASLKIEAKDLINNLQYTNEKFSCHATSYSTLK